ncbi:MAG: response regulator [Acidimicrobiales bacterium]
MLAAAVVRVLLVDDDPGYREVMAELFATEESLELVGDAQDAVRAMQAVDALRPDVVVSDVRMPGTDGVELAHCLTGGARGSRPRVLALSAFASDAPVVRALAAGASGFIAKSARWEDLVRAIQVVHAGGVALPPELSRRVIDLVVPSLGPHEELSARETDVLALVGRGWSNQQIADCLHVSIGTVRTHMEHAREKLRCTSRVELALAARSLGLVTERAGDHNGRKHGNADEGA